MMLSDYAIKKMGFSENVPPVKVGGILFVIKVYTLQGVFFDDSECVHANSFNEHCKFGMGNNVNDICNALFNDSYTDDIEKWEKENKVTSPYLITLASNLVKAERLCQWSQNAEGKLLTYDCFAKEKSDLIDFLNVCEIPYLPLLLSTLSPNDRPARIKHICSTIYGEMDDGKIFTDIRMTGNVEAWANSKASLPIAMNDFVSNKNSYLAPPSPIGNLIYDSMQEADKLKSFLFTWNSLEITIQKYFTLFCDSDSFPDNNIPSAYSQAVSDLFNNPARGRRITALSHKFLYLCIFNLKNMDIADFQSFLEIKKVRDDFIHGKRLKPEVFAVPTTKAYILLNKVFSDSACPIR